MASPRKCILILSTTALLCALSFGAEALPVPADPTGSALVTRAAEGCGRGFFRNARGFCRPMRGSHPRDFDRPRRRGDDFRAAPRARGAFSRTCFDMEQTGPYLSATCRKIGGGYRRSRINLRRCRSVGNKNGRLVCE